MFIPVPPALQAPPQEATLPEVKVRSTAAKEGAGPARDHEARRKAPVQTVTLSGEELRRYADQTLGDVLRRLPGMTFTGPAGVAKDIRIRGLDKGYTSYLIDGQPVALGKKDRAFSVDRIPAEMIERIEIIHNPSADMDANGVGGTVNIVLKAPDARRRSLLQASLGRQGNHATGDAMVSHDMVLGPMDLLLTGGHTAGFEDIVETKQRFNAAGAPLDSETKQKPVRKTETFMAPRLGWNLGGSRLVVEPTLSRGTEDKREGSEVRNAAGALSKRTANAEDKVDHVGRLGLRWSGGETFRWEFRGGAERASEAKDKTAREWNAAGALTKTTVEREDNREDASFLGGQLARSLGSHRLKGGLEWRRGEFTATKTKLENGADKTDPKDRFEVTEQRGILFLQDGWSLAPGHTLTPGFRFERITRDARGALGANTDAPAATASNPSLHYLWALNAGLNFRASAAQTTKLPKFDDLNPLVRTATGAGAGSLTNPDKAGNAGLQAEKARGIDVGMEAFFQEGSGVLGLTFYRREVRDFVEKSTRLEGTRYVERPMNVGEARFWGAEFDFRARVLNLAAFRLDALGNHARFFGRVSDTRNGIDRDVKDLAPHLTNLGLEATAREGRLALGANLVLMPGFTSDTVNPDGIREIKSSEAMRLLDAYLAYAPKANLTFRLAAKNLLSVEKRERTTKFRATGAFDNAEAKQEASKPTVTFGVSWRF